MGRALRIHICGEGKAAALGRGGLAHCCDEVSRQALADPARAEAGLVLQHCPELGQGGELSYPVTDVGEPPKGGEDFGKAPFSSRGLLSVAYPQLGKEPCILMGHMVVHDSAHQVSSDHWNSTATLGCT